MPRLPTPTAAIAPSAGPGPGPLDDLQQRIATQRALLTAWQSARDAAQVRYARDIAPLHDAYCALLAQQVQQLDVASAYPGLSKADRAALRELVADWAGMLASASSAQAQRAEMQDIQRRHAEATAQPVPPPGDGDDDDDEGIDPQDGAGGPDAAADEPAPQDGESDGDSDWEAARAAADKRRAAHHAARKSRTRAGQAAPAVPSLREVYRRVASALHPDREPDPAARERKTALMQQTNRAYAAQDLLGLLELLNDANGNGRVPPAASLAPYQALLAAQLAALQREVAAAAQAFCDEFGVEGGARLTPDKALAPLRAQAQQLREAIAWQRAALKDLPRDADGVRRWMREERAMQRRGGD
ncbi:MAG: hypothetical protein J0H69_22560 [Burkholderiales bacterium]|nr:hypothetical protein [Burkholderiales bacterium]